MARKPKARQPPAPAAPRAPMANGESTWPRCWNARDFRPVSGLSALGATPSSRARHPSTRPTGPRSRRPTREPHLSGAEDEHVMVQIERTFLALQGYLLRRLTTAPGVPPPAEVETAGALAGNPPRLPASRDHEKCLIPSCSSRSMPGWLSV